MPIQHHARSERMNASDFDDPRQDFEEIVTAWRRTSGLRVVVAIHSVRRGPALGGTRYRLLRRRVR